MPTAPIDTLALLFVQTLSSLRHKRVQTDNYAKNKLTKE